mgnify:FL=1
MLTDINELWIGYLLLSEQFHYIQHFILFQYISCYSLSGSIGELSVVNRLFQYISCYSLSVTGNTYGAKDVRFNTSHVTLYRKTIQYPQYPFCRFQYISCYSLSWSITDNKRLKRVSIHLMLLFIKTGGINDGKIITVSIHLMLLFIEALLKISGLHIAVSIHLMLLFIFCCWFLWLHIKFVSIHLMLLFIKLHKTL